MLYFIVLSSPSPVIGAGCKNTICKEYTPKEMHSAYSSKHSDSTLFKTDLCKSTTDADKHEFQKKT